MKKGYTLAEVLITLGIVGVVAAITISVVVSKIQWTILKTQYKKVYTTYSQAIQLIQNENETYPVECYYDNSGSVKFSDCKLFYDKLRENLKIVKYCEKNALSNGCVPVYSSYNMTQGCYGFSENYINNKNTAWILNDGSIFIKYTYNHPFFAVDINGFKGPNKAGYDLFFYKIKAKNIGLYLDTLYGGCGWEAPGGKSGKDMLK